MRTARYRLTRYDEPAAKGTPVQLPSTGRYELYDYEADPAAEQNLAADSKNKDLLEKLISQMEVGWRAARPGTDGK